MATELPPCAAESVPMAIFPVSVIGPIPIALAFLPAFPLIAILSPPPFTKPLYW